MRRTVITTLRWSSTALKEARRHLLQFSSFNLVGSADLTKTKRNAEKSPPKTHLFWSTLGEVLGNWAHMEESQDAPWFVYLWFLKLLLAMYKLFVPGSTIMRIWNLDARKKDVNEFYLNFHVFDEPTGIHNQMFEGYLCTVKWIHG